MRIRELSLTLRTFLTAYRWRKNVPVHITPLRKPLSQCRVALVTSAGLVVPGDRPFDQRRGGDFSHRVIPAGTDVQELEEQHRSDAFDHAGIEADRNVCFPLDRLAELAADGVIGEVAPRHVSLMGSITAPGRLVRQTIPQITDLLVADEVDMALLVPV